MIYSVVKIQVNGLTFSWFGINPFTHLDKGGQNAHPKSPLFQKFLEKNFFKQKSRLFSSKLRSIDGGQKYSYFWCIIRVNQKKNLNFTVSKECVKLYDCIISDLLNFYNHLYLPAIYGIIYLWYNILKFRKRWEDD